MDGLSGGFLFGAGGSGLITPRMGVMSPELSGANTPAGMGMGGGCGMGGGSVGAVGQQQQPLTQMKINTAFGDQVKGEGRRVIS